MEEGTCTGEEREEGLLEDEEEVGGCSVTVGRRLSTSARYLEVELTQSSPSL